MKKIISMLMSVVFILAILSGCSSTAGSSADTSAADAASENTENSDSSSGNAGKNGFKPGDFPGEPPEGFDGELPEGFDGKFPEGFDGERPEGFPEGFDGEFPEGLDGKMPEDFNGERPEGFPGEPPEGFSGGKPGERPDGSSSGGNRPGGKPGSGSSSSIEYSGATEISSSDDQSRKTYSSSKTDESALLISTSDDVTISDPTVSKTGDSDGGDNCSFYGVNAAVLVKGGTETTITGGKVTSDATGANGVFCYGGNGGKNGASGDGTTLYITDTVITTTGDGSGGIMTTGGGITYASDLKVTTSGRSSAAIRTDRGGGTVNVEGGTYTTSGLGSPAIYSTADVTAAYATLVSEQSEGICIEGLNSVTLVNCDLTAENTNCNGNATFLDSIMIYQSMSGDAASGTSTFTMSGGSLTSMSGHVFHVTNTSAVINLTGVKITNEDEDNILLSVCADGWSGCDNEAVLKATSQKLEGTILVGSDSSFSLELSGKSSFKGTFSGEIKNTNGKTVSTEIGEVTVKLDSDSTWTLTGDTYITKFSGSAKNVISNGYTLYVNGTPLTGTK